MDPHSNRMDGAGDPAPQSTGDGEQIGHYIPSGSGGGGRDGKAQPKKRITKSMNKNKKRGPKRKKTKLGGKKKQAQALKRKDKRRMNRDLGKAGIKPKKI